MTLLNEMDRVAPRPRPATYPEGITVEQGRLRTVQRVHAITIAVVPAIGTAAALWIAFAYGVTWVDMTLLAVMYVVNMLGISLGYHRQFSHRSFKAKPWVRVMLAIFGSTAAQGSVVYWVSNHRRHHQYTDKAGDIHSPYVNDDGVMGIVKGFWHSHMGWTFDHKMTNALHYAKDLYRDPAISRVNQLYFLWVALGLLVPALIGGLLTMSLWGAFTGFLWGGLVRMFLCYHFTNGIDSVTHIFGRRPLESGDYSTNNVVWALPTLGEGWHNNHHTFPSSAIFGLERWQPDPGAWLLRLLERFGQVWDIQRPSREMIAACRKPAG
jgi:stearoyl-CoA desaturase (delta-9 desaturase)